MPDPWAGPVEALKELDLGDKGLGLLVPIPIPDRTLGFTMVVRAPAQNEVIGVSLLRNPSSVAVVSNFAMDGHNTQVFGNLGWVAAANPQADSAAAFPVQAGKWRFLLGDDDGSVMQAHVSVWVRRTEDGQFHGGVMDVNVFIAPNVANQGYMNQVLSAMFNGKYAGVDLGTVTFYSLPQSATVISDYNEYRALIASTGGVGTHPALNLFVVQDFSDNGFGQAIGVAAGIPGNAPESGTTLSGVAYTPTGDPNYDGSILRHEVGHLGGLFHTTEFQITETDSMSDTPSCDSNTIQNNPNACPDNGNMMFPIAYGATAMSTGQLRVIQGSALYRGVLNAGGTPASPFPKPPSPNSPAPWGIAEMLVDDGPDPLLDEGIALPASPSPLISVLGGVYCKRGSDPEALAIEVAGDAQTLLDVAYDLSLPSFVRARALRAFVRASASNALSLDQAEAFAFNEGEHRLVRVAALGALVKSDGVRAAWASASLRYSADPVLAAAAERIMR